MHQFRLIHLFLSSLIGLLFFACSPTAGYQLQGKLRVTEANVNPIIPKNESLLFKTKIDLYSKHYSGLLIVKQTDSTTKHITFVTELGMKMFDFEVKGKTFTPVYVFEPINKANIISVLSNDLQLLFLLKIFDTEADVFKNEQGLLVRANAKPKTYYKTYASQEIQSITVKGALKTKMTVQYQYSSTKTLEAIYLRHKGLFPIKMKLTVLPTTNP